MSTLTRATCAAAVLAAVLCTAAPAGAAAHPSPRAGSAGTSSGAGQAGPRTFGIQTSGPNGPDSRGVYTYGVTAGARITDYADVVNISDKPATLHIYAADGYNSAAGSFDLIPATTRSTEVGAWINASQADVTVPARSHTVVPFTLAVPGNATPGDHAGGIVASLESTGTDAKGNTVRLDERVGARVYLRVAGALNPALSVTDVKVDPDLQRSPFGTVGADLSWTVRNTGNVRLGGKQAVRVTGLLTDATAAAVPDVPILLPGSSFTSHTHVSGILPALAMTTRITLTPSSPVGDIDPTLRTEVHQVHFLAVPWASAALLLLLIGAGFTWRRRIRRRGTGAARPASHRGAQHPAQQPGERSPVVVRSRLRARISAPAALAALATLLGVLHPTAALAATGNSGGTLTFLLGSGLDTDPTWMVTSGPCPAAATDVLATVTGAGFPAAGTLVVPNSHAEVSSTEAMTVPFQKTMSDFAAEAGIKQLSGPYRVTVRCIDRLDRTTYAAFTGTMNFSGHHFTAPTPTVVPPGAPDLTPAKGTVAATAPQAGAPGPAAGAGKPSAAATGSTGTSQNGSSATGAGVVDHAPAGHPNTITIAPTASRPGGSGDTAILAIIVLAALALTGTLANRLLARRRDRAETLAVQASWADYDSIPSPRAAVDQEQARSVAELN